jgi:hypothetical protein
MISARQRMSSFLNVASQIQLLGQGARSVSPEAMLIMREYGSLKCTLLS